MAVSLTQTIAPAAPNLAAIAALQSMTNLVPMTLAATSFGDGLGHQVALTSGDVYSGSTFTFTGTDVNNQVIAETITGPNINTVYTTKLFKTVTSITSTSGTNAATIRAGFDGTGDTEGAAIILEIYDSIGAMVEVVATGTVNFTVDQAVNPIIKKQSFAGTTWYPITALSTETASTMAQLSPGISAIKVVINSYSTGATLTVNVNQPSRGAQ